MTKRIAAIAIGLGLALGLGLAASGGSSHAVNASYYHTIAPRG